MLFLCPFFVACAAGGREQTGSDHEYREIEREIRDEEFRRRCVSRGGYVYTEGTRRSRIRGTGNRSSRIECATTRRDAIIG